MCEAFLENRQPLAPKLSSRKLDDRRMVTSPTCRATSRRNTRSSRRRKTNSRRYAAGSFVNTACPVGKYQGCSRLSAKNSSTAAGHGRDLFRGLPEDATALGRRACARGFVRSARQTQRACLRSIAGPGARHGGLENAEALRAARTWASAGGERGNESCSRSRRGQRKRRRRWLGCWASATPESPAHLRRSRLASDDQNLAPAEYGHKRIEECAVHRALCEQIESAMWQELETRVNEGIRCRVGE
jgi:hypothetical protein